VAGFTPEVPSIRKGLPMRSLLPWLWKNGIPVLTGICFVLALWETAWQIQDARHVGQVAHTVVREAGAVTLEEKVLALRDYLRRNIDFHGAAYNNRPFLRATAGETLSTGKGYCGDVTRTFICMAAAVDVPAYRVNLYGRSPHTVAAVELKPGSHLVVDCSPYPMTISDLQSLDKVMLRPEYTDYSTLNLRRLGIASLVTRPKLMSESLTFWTENPNALKALLFTSLGAGLLVSLAVRHAWRRFLSWRGWVHRSNIPALKDALNQTEKGPQNAAVDCYRA
jgi:hypothetical protein